MATVRFRTCTFAIFSLLFFAIAAVRADTPGQRLPGSIGTRETTAEIAARQAASPAKGERPEHELEYPERSGLPQHPGARASSRFPEVAPGKEAGPGGLKIHTTGSAFNGATLTDTGAFPPDSMGTVGPSQLIVFVNGRIRSFTKAGVADGVINADPDVFFASVRTPVGGSVVLDFTSDPQIRYDRFTARWFLSIIDVPCTNAGCTTTAANRWMVAVSDAASNGVITGSTVWTFFQFQADAGTNFCDYPSLGVDVNALYVGCNMFSSAGSFVGTNGYVVRKTSILSAGPLTVTSFANLAAGAGVGPESPRGVDNFDPGATEGYFVGPDNAAFGAITFRRVSNPGSATPTISANIVVSVSTTTSPNPVTHLGNTGGNNGRLDSLDDRFFQAMIRNGRLWASHNLRVDATGTASTVAAARNASRWYEFQNLTTTPTVVQSGTVFDNAATLAAARQYFIPSVTVTGQGHAVLAMTMAGTPVGATPAFVGRLAGDTLGTMTGPPTVAAVAFGTTTANYNPASDPGGSTGRRWGDYSFTVVDPLDDMSVWAIQEYNQASNSYALRVGRLLAPPPATPTCSGSPIAFSGPTGNVVIAATSSGGSGFYDPGANLTAPALPFTHITATVTNATVNSVTYNSPTQVTLNITAAVAGLQNVTLTNPDGQSVTATGCINVAGGGGTPDLSLTKSDGGASVAPGGTAAYTLTYANTGTVGATGVVLTETVPANSVFNPGASTAGWVCPMGNNAGSTCTLAIGAVGTGGGGMATFATTTFNPMGAGVTQISNTASVADDGTHGADPTPGNNTASDTTPLTGAPDLALTKSDGGISVAPGDTFLYTLTYTNTGNRGASGVVITETVPANTTFNSGASTAGWVCTPNNNAGSTCTFAVGAAPVDGTPHMITFAVNVANPVPAGVTQISNTASISDNGANGTDSTPGNNSGSDTTPVVAPPVLTSIAPTSGTTAGGTIVALTGTGFVNGATVLFGAVPATSVTFNSSTSLTATTPAQAAGTVAVTVTNPDTQSSTLAAAYTYVTPTVITGYFYSLTPCRIVDTRNVNGPTGGPALLGGTVRNFPIAGNCGVPADATAVSINVTVVGPTASGDLRLFPAGITPPVVSTVNFSAGQIRANNAVISINGATPGSIGVQTDMTGGNSTHFLLDVNGYIK